MGFDAILTSGDPSISSSVAFDVWLIFETVRLYEGRALLSFRSSAGGKVRHMKSKVTLRSLMSQSTKASSDRQSPSSPEAGSKEKMEMKIIGSRNLNKLQVSHLQLNALIEGLILISNLLL